MQSRTVCNVISRLADITRKGLSCIFCVLENEVDGSLLLNDGFDDSMIKELIPNLKHRVLFNNERKKLK